MKPVSHSAPLAGAALLKLALIALVLVVVLAPAANACYVCNFRWVAGEGYMWICDLVGGPQWGNEGCLQEVYGGWCDTYGLPCTNGGAGCFLAGTMISTPDGDRPIEALREGDAIWCVGEDGKRVAGKITKTYRDVRHGYYLLNGSTFVTGDHRFLTTRSHNNFGAVAAAAGYEQPREYEQHSLGEWIPLRDLAPGQELLSFDGDVITIETIEFVDRGVRVFNFEVVPHHNYFADGMLVHNKKPDPNQP